MIKKKKNEEPEAFSVSFTLTGFENKMLFVNSLNFVMKQAIVRVRAHDYLLGTADKKASEYFLKQELARNKSVVLWAKSLLEKYAGKIAVNRSVTIKLNEFDSLMFYEAILNTDYAHCFFDVLEDIDKWLIVQNSKRYREIDAELEVPHAQLYGNE